LETFITRFNSAVDFQDPVEITPDTVLAEIAQWDSLAALGVIVMFDLEYGKTIDAEMLKNCKSIKDLYQLTL
jgi:acyl carrier protein